MLTNKLKKPIIAVDVDDVLVPHFQDLIDWYNQEYGTKLALTDQYSHNLAVWGATSNEQAIRRVHRFFDMPEFLDAEPFAEAVQAVRTLADNYELVVITARDTIIQSVTQNWLDTHFTDLFKAAHFTAQFSLEGKARSKVDVCSDIGAAFLIDDTFSTCAGVAEKGMSGLLFGEYPWNESAELTERVIRVKDWAAILEYFNARR